MKQPWPQGSVRKLKKQGVRGAVVPDCSAHCTCCDGAGTQDSHSFKYLIDFGCGFHRVTPLDFELLTR
jgi:hypothetical protein